LPIERIQPKGLTVPPGYSHVVKAGNLVFVAGQVAMDSSGTLIGWNDIETQADQVYENLRIALSSVGADFSKLVKTTTYMTRPEDIEGYRRSRAKNISSDLPTSTLILVSGLANPDFLIEIEAVATLG